MQAPNDEDEMPMRSSKTSALAVPTPWHRFAQGSVEGFNGRLTEISLGARKRQRSWARLHTNALSGIKVREPAGDKVPRSHGSATASLQPRLIATRQMTITMAMGQQSTQSKHERRSTCGARGSAQRSDHS